MNEKLIWILSPAVFSIIGMVAGYLKHPFFPGVLLVLFLAQADEPEKSKDDELSAQRLQLMEQRIAAITVASDEEGFPKAFNSRPIFRYTDPARNYVAAAVWKLGESGRPKAIVTTELNRQFFGRSIISYEYLSLTQTRFTATADDVKWAPKDSVLTFKPVPGSDPPDESPRRRLLQLRSIAKRFGGDEEVENETCELRLLPQPVDRYTPSTAEHADGAIFLLCYGTNPEVALFIESDGKSWSYAAGRLTGAGRVQLTIDGTTAWTGPAFKYGFNQPYDSSNTPVEIPGVAADGSEIRK